MTDIRTTVTEALPTNVRRGYSQYVNPVIDAVSQREETIKQGLRSYALDRGLSDTEVDSLFRTVGFEITAEAGSSATEQALAEIAEQVEELSKRLNALRS